QYEGAAEQARHGLEIEPNRPVTMGLLGEAYSSLGRHEEGIALLEKSVRCMPGEAFAVGFLGWAYVRAGRRDDAQRFLEELEERRRTRYVPGGTIALAALALEDVPAAARWVEQAVHARDPNLSTLIVSPHFKLLRSKSPWQNVVRQMNLQP